MRLAAALLAALLLAPALASAQVAELHPPSPNNPANPWLTQSIPCPTDGISSIQVSFAGTYELLVSGDAWVCHATSTCPTGGDFRAKGNHGVFWFPRDARVSCRSLDGSSMVQIVPVRVAR